MFVVKLGGSVITDKDNKNTFRKKTVCRLATEIKKAKKQIILIHGAGSFGHITAKKYKLNQGYKNNDQLKGFSSTHSDVRKLNLMVVDILNDLDIPAVSVPPLAALTLNDHKINSFNFELFENLLEKGFMPVTFGDVVLDKKLVFSICSGDLIAESLSDHFKPENSVFVIDEDGLYTKNPKINKDAVFIDSTTVDKLEKLSTTADAHADVTQGMEGKIDKIKKIANLGIDTVVLNGNKHNRLYNTLIGEKDKVTIVHGGKNESD